MDYGRVLQPERADVSLPPLDPTNLRATPAHTGQAARAAFFCGVSTWTNPEWKGVVYPTRMKQSDALLHYARQFNLIELNSTHYGTPPPATIARWRELARQGEAEGRRGPFRFCPKLPQEFSHRRRLRVTQKEVVAFADAMRGFASLLGPCFLQLPPEAGLEVLPALAEFLASWPEDLPLAVEFRHADFFPGRRLHTDARECLESWGAGLVVIDTLGHREVVHRSVTAPFLLLRFLGSEAAPIDDTRLDTWSEALVPMIGHEVNALYAFLHSPGIVAAASLSNGMARRLNERFGAGLLPYTPFAPPEPSFMGK